MLKTRWDWENGLTSQNFKTDLKIRDRSKNLTNTRIKRE